MRLRTAATEFRQAGVRSADYKNNVWTISTKVDAERQELLVSLASARAADAWQPKGAIRIQRSADGSPCAVAIPDYRKWANRRNALADLIAQELRIHQDDAVQALVDVVF